MDALNEGQSDLRSVVVILPLVFRSDNAEVPRQVVERVNLAFVEFNVVGYIDVERGLVLSRLPRVNILGPGDGVKIIRPLDRRMIFVRVLAVAVEIAHDVTPKVSPLSAEVTLHVGRRI